MVNTAAQIHLTKSEPKVCVGSNPAVGVLEIRNSEDVWRWSRLEIRLNAFLGQPYHKNNSSSSSSSSSSQEISPSKKPFLKINFMAPFHTWGSTVSRHGGSHYKDIVYFLPLSFLEYLVLISSALEEWEWESSALTIRPFFSTPDSKISGPNPIYMFGQALKLNLNARLWLTTGSYKISN